eukprot:scaffold76454_cov18-Tisochrysis_lutea.AAC.1
MSDMPPRVTILTFCLSLAADVHGLIIVWRCGYSSSRPQRWGRMTWRVHGSSSSATCPKCACDLQLTEMVWRVRWNSSSATCPKEVSKRFAADRDKAWRVHWRSSSATCPLEASMQFAADSA